MRMQRAEAPASEEKSAKKKKKKDKSEAADGDAAATPETAKSEKKKKKEKGGGIIATQPWAPPCESFRALLLITCSILESCFILPSHVAYTS